jgi:hypothetical protein
MKSLKFQPHLRDLILNGQKISTWRFFDDKDIQVGNELEFFVNGEEYSFGHATVTDVVEKKVCELTPEELKAQNYDSVEKVIENHTKFMNREVNKNTDLKIITFRLM